LRLAGKFVEDGQDDPIGMQTKQKHVLRSDLLSSTVTQPLEFSYQIS